MTKDQRIYFDHNATTPLSEEFLNRFRELAMVWGNPSSIHWAGRLARGMVAQTRNSFAEAMGVSPLEVVFTSGGSESNNWVFQSVYEKFKGSEKNHYLVSNVEHPSVTKSAERLVELGAHVDWIPVDRFGRLDMDFLKSRISAKTALVSVMYANNETGVIHPLDEVVAVARAHNVLIHSDVVQAFGKLSFNLKKMDVDYASFSAHKFYAMKGVGVLYVKKGSPLTPLIMGGGQERKRRGGTENVLGIASLGVMVERLGEVSTRYEGLKSQRDYFERLVLEKIPRVHITALEQKRLPNTSSMVIEGVDGESLLMNLDIHGIAVSTGAACSSGTPEPSPILIAMGLSRQEAQSSLRVSLGWGNTTEEIDKFVEVLENVVQRLRGLSQGQKEERE